MHRSLEQYEIIGFFAVVMIGTCFHPLFELSNNSLFIGLFAPINESVWEHLKLLFYPYILYSLFEYYTTKNTYSQFILYKFYSVCVGMLAIIVCYYTYSGIMGRNYVVIDILIFIFSSATAFYVSYYLLTHSKENKQTKLLGISLFLIMSMLFSLLTFYHPDLPLFESPGRLSIISLLQFI